MSESSYKIAHILPSTVIGGTEQATLRIAQATESSGFESVVFWAEHATVVRDFFQQAGLSTFTYQAVEPSYRRPVPYLRASLRLARTLRQQKVDLIHCADVLAAHYTGLAGRLAGIPVISHVRNRYSEISRRDRTFLTPVNKWVFVSRDTWKHFALDVPESRGTVVYDGIDVKGSDESYGTAVREEFGIPHNAPIVGMVARVAPQKDYFTLARAAQKVIQSQPEVRLLVVGDKNPEHYAKVHKALVEMNVDSRFIFTGFRSDTQRIIAAMNVFVLCTHYEGLPLVLLEAMAQARPVIATNVDGVPEIVLPGQTGLLHQHENAEELAAHILTLLRDQRRAQQLGQEARQYVACNFSHKEFAASMSRVYQEMLHTGHLLTSDSGTLEKANQST